MNTQNGKNENDEVLEALKEKMLNPETVAKVAEGSEDDKERFLMAANRHGIGRQVEYILKNWRQPEIRKRKRHTKTGDVEEVQQTITNCHEAIMYDPQLFGKIHYNELTFAPYISGQLPWMIDGHPREWNTGDDAFLRQYLEKYGLMNVQKINDAFEMVIRSSQFNPIRDALIEIRTNKWDHKEGHIRKLLPEYLGCEDSDYNFECMKLLMLAAVKRIFQPGCKYDLMVILVGRQGIGKSQFTRTLALYPEWYCDNFNTFEPDKAVAQLRGFWIVEVAEMLATKRAREVESIKAFITSQNDAYREPYSRRTENRPRRCVFVGTTNDEGFLTDKTGNRRFLPIATGVMAPMKSLFADRGKVMADFYNAWGEAVDLYMQNPNVELILPSTVADAVANAQIRYMADDVRIGLIQNYLDERKLLTPVCVAELYQEALGNYDRIPARHESNDLHMIMKSSITGWQRLEKKARCGKYGSQWAYVKDPKNVPNNERELGTEGFQDADEQFEIPFDGQ